MKIGFHYHVPAELRGDRIYTAAYQGRFLDAVAEHCEELVCWLHDTVEDEKEQADYELRARNVVVRSVGPHDRVPRRLVRAWLGKVSLLDLDRIDVAMIRAPTPLLPWVFRKAERESVPVALLVVGDQTATDLRRTQPAWRALLIRMLLRWNERWLTRAMGRGPVLVNSRELYRKYQGRARNLFEVRTTTLSAKDFYIRADSCLSRSVHLLYTGRLTPMKGVADLLGAMARLVSRGHDLVIELAGWEDPPGYWEQLRAQARQLGIDDRLVFHGYKPVGLALWELYRRADIFVLPSYSEGFPRTIWEAMANSLPVVATKVGSIPDFVGDAVQIVEPGDADALAEAIERLIRDPELRRASIRKGLSIAKECTLEVQCARMAEILERWLEVDRSGCGRAMGGS